MTTNRSMIAKSLIPGVHEFVGLSYGETPQEHLPLYEVLKSDRSFEEEVYVSGMGGADVKPEGKQLCLMTSVNLTHLVTNTKRLL